VNAHHHWCGHSHHLNELWIVSLMEVDHLWAGRQGVAQADIDGGAGIEQLGAMTQRHAGNLHVRLDQ
jgi:hypothetical protein